MPCIVDFLHSNRWIGFVVFALLSSAVSMAQPPIDPILLTGDSVPGRPGEQFDSIEQFAINDNDQIVVDVETTVGAGIWARDGSGTTFFPLVEIGDAAPEIEDAFFEVWPRQPIRLASSGRIVVLFGLTGSGVSDASESALYAMDVNSGELVLVVQRGDPAPGTGTTFTGLSPVPSVAADGRFVFNASLDGVDNEVGSRYDAIYGVAVPGEPPQLLALSGEPAQGLGVGVVFDTIRGSAIRGDNLLIRAVVRGPGIDSDNRSGIWLRSLISNTDRLIARTGEQAADLPAGVVYESITSELLDNGAIGIEAKLDGPGIESSNDGAVFVFDGSGGADLLLREGDSVGSVDLTVATILDVTFSAAGLHTVSVILSGDGVDSSNNYAFVRIAEGSTPVIFAREGTEMPAGSSEYFGRNDNDSGQIATVVGPSLPNASLYVTTSGGSFIEVAGVGDRVTVDGIQESVEYVPQLTLGTRGTLDALANDGMLAFWLNLQDGRFGVFQLQSNYLIFADGFEKSSAAP